MQKPEIPKNETERLQALFEYSVLDTIPERDFDAITKLASEICNTPISLVSLIDGSRQWFKSHHGLSANQTSKEYAFCAHAINRPQEIMIVQDSRLDERFYDNPLVTGDPNVVFYAGVPLVTPSGFPLGTICVIDHQPKQLTDGQLSALEVLSQSIISLFELRKKNIEQDKQKALLELTLSFFEQTGKVARVGGWEVDLVKNKINWTAVTAEIHEVAPDFEPKLEKSIRFYKEGESREKIIRLVDQAVKYGTGFDAELEIVTARGNERWVRAIGKPEMVNNTCTRLYGIFQDIHEQKLKDIQLERSENMFRNIFDNAYSGMALVLADGNPIKVNKSYCRILGYTEAELLGTEIRAITHPDDLNSHLEILDKFAKDELQEIQFEKRFIHKNGQVVSAIISISMSQDILGNPVQLMQITDTTATKKAEQTIKDERKLLRTLIDNIPLNIFIKDLQSRKILVNQKEVQYTGFKDEAAIIGKDDFELCCAKSAEIYMAEDQQVIQSGVAIIDKEIHHIKSDGSKNWFLMSKIPLKNEQQHITGLLGINYDITERKRKDKKLEALLDVTSEQNLRLLNFAHIVSHNLRSHANNFSMLLQFLETEKDAAAKEEMFDLLKNASTNLSQTVNELNEIVAANTTMQQEIQSINLYDAIQKVQDGIKAQLLTEKVECINHVDASINIKAVPAYLDSILLNFLTNGIKYKSACRKPFIQFNTQAKGDSIILSIQDNGIGIDMQKNGEKLFGMYKTFHGNKDARGIGLFITKNQVESMGGNIAVESTLNEGTIFNIDFLKA